MAIFMAHITSALTAYSLEVGPSSLSKLKVNIGIFKGKVIFFSSVYFFIFSLKRELIMTTLMMKVWMTMTMATEWKFLLLVYFNFFSLSTLYLTKIFLPSFYLLGCSVG